MRVRRPSDPSSRAHSSVVLPGLSPSARISDPPPSRMTRRNFIALVSLCVLVMFGLLVVGVGVFLTQSRYGQDALRSTIQGRVQAGISGKVHLGRIHGNFLTGLTLDSLELRDD